MSELPSEITSATTFGCKQCWPAAAEAAHTAVHKLAFLATLVSESHYNVVIRVCRACSQRFLSVSTEMIAWSGGSDAQYWTLFPIRDEEATDLISLGEAVTNDVINALGKGRKCLQIDHPSEGPVRICWGSNFTVGPHD